MEKPTDVQAVRVRLLCNEEVVLTLSYREILQAETLETVLETNDLFLPFIHRFGHQNMSIEIDGFVTDGKQTESKKAIVTVGEQSRFKVNGKELAISTVTMPRIWNQALLASAA